MLLPEKGLPFTTKLNVVDVLFDGLKNIKGYSPSFINNEYFA
jgi:hypothetical protein